MNVLLTPELEQFVEERIKAGKYSSAIEVIREALWLLEERDGERSPQPRRNEKGNCHWHRRTQEGRSGRWGGGISRAVRGHSSHIGVKLMSSFGPIKIGVFVTIDKEFRLINPKKDIIFGAGRQRFLRAHLCRVFRSPGGHTAQTPYCSLA